MMCLWIAIGKALQINLSTLASSTYLLTCSRLTTGRTRIQACLEVKWRSDICLCGCANSNGSVHELTICMETLNFHLAMS